MKSNSVTFIFVLIIKGQLAGGPILPAQAECQNVFLETQ